MAKPFSKLDQTLKELVEAYSQLEDSLEEKFGNDEENYASAVIEALETAIEGALEEHDVSTAFMATMLSNLTEALEELDPSAFEEGEEDEIDYDLDDVEYELDEDEEEDDEDLEDEDEDEDEE